MTMRISIAVALLLACFQRFFLHLLGLINHLNPYTVQESYHNGVSYSKKECKKRSIEVVMDKIVRTTMG